MVTSCTARTRGRNAGYQVCNQVAGTKGLHSLLCKKGGFVVRRHDTVRDLFANMLTEMLGIPAHTEQHPPGELPDNRRPDVDYFDKNLVRQYLDIAVVTPHTRALPGSAAVHRQGALIEREESSKRRKYHTLGLTPVVMSHLGRFGGGSQSGPRRRSTALATAALDAALKLNEGQHPVPGFQRLVASCNGL